MISDIVNDILEKKRKETLKRQADAAKEQAPADAAKVNEEIKDMATAGIDGATIHKADKPTEEKPTEQEEPKEEALPGDDDQTLVPAVPNVDISSSDPNIFVRRFMANVADAKLMLTKEQLKALEDDIKSTNLSINTAILKCKGPDLCVYGKVCMLNKIYNGAWPIGQVCPMEKTIAEIYYTEYVSALGLQPGDIGIIEFNQIMSLIECDLIEMRANSHINEEGMTQMVTTFVNHKTGDRAETEELSVMFGIKEKVSKRKDTILKQLLATPEVRAKYKVTNLTDKERKDARVVADESRAKLIELNKKPGDEQDAGPKKR